MLTLFYVPRTRANRVRWMLEELDEPYQLQRVDVAAGENRTADYLAGVHPLGHVPALREGDTTLFETAAIVAWLADRFPEKHLAPAPASADRGLYYQWMFFAMSELEPHCESYSLHTMRLPEEKRLPVLAEIARDYVHRNLRVLETALSDGRPYLLSEFSAADVVMGGVVGWAFMMRLVVDLPHVAAYSKRLADRDANKRSRAD